VLAPSLGELLAREGGIASSQVDHLAGNRGVLAVSLRPLRIQLYSV
jgi:hypothetical protein